MYMFQALCKPVSDVLAERLQAVVAEQMGTNFMAAALKQLGLNCHDILFFLMTQIDKKIF